MRYVVLVVALVVSSSGCGGAPAGSHGGGGGANGAADPRIGTSYESLIPAEMCPDVIGPNYEVCPDGTIKGCWGASGAMKNCAAAKYNKPDGTLYYCTDKCVGESATWCRDPKGEPYLTLMSKALCPSKAPYSDLLKWATSCVAADGTSLAGCAVSWTETSGRLVSYTCFDVCPPSGL